MGKGKKRAKNNNKNRGFDVWSILNFFGTLGLIQIIIFCVLFIAGLFAWLYVFSLGSDIKTKIIMLEGIVYLLILVVTIVCMFMVGYSRNSWGFFKNSYIFAITASVFGYYLADFPLLSYPVSERGVYMYYILRFLAYILMSAALSLIPILIIAAIRNLIIGICDAVFGK